MKKLLSGRLPIEKINCCPINCMIYWQDDRELERYKFCNTLRFKDNSWSFGVTKKKQVVVAKMYCFSSTPQLQRLYASKVIAEQMHLHATSLNNGVMHHFVESPTWKYLDSVYLNFALECRNMQLSLSTDGSRLLGQSGRQYSSWLVILKPYNLPH